MSAGSNDHAGAAGNDRSDGCGGCGHFQDAEEITKLIRTPRDGFCFKRGVTVMKSFGRICHDFDPAPAAVYWRRLI